MNRPRPGDPFSLPFLAACVAGVVTGALIALAVLHALGIPA